MSLSNIAAYNKAIAALIMAIIGVANLIWPGAIGVSETAVSAIVAGITPVIVYLIPNKPIAIV